MRRCLANEMLNTASAFFADARQPRQVFVDFFVSEHKDRIGVEPICRVLVELVETDRGNSGGLCNCPGPQDVAAASAWV